MSRFLCADRAWDVRVCVRARVCVTKLVCQGHERERGHGGPRGADRYPRPKCGRARGGAQARLGHAP
jgi:hypothetical protein